MNQNGSANNSRPEETYFLSETIGSKVMLNGKRLGKLEDLVIVDRDKVAEVVQLYVERPFGYPALIVPWEKVKSMTSKEITIDIDDPGKYELEPAADMVMLRDYILDKKVVDMEGREVEVVYDVKMVRKNNKMYVSDVDLSRYGLLRRIGLKGLANFIYSLADKIKDQTIAWSYVEPLPTQISGFDGDVKLKVLKEKLDDMPPVDLADILEEMDHEQRIRIFDKLDPEKAADTLEEIDPKVQRDIVISLKKDKTAKLLGEMTPGQAADILSVLPWAEANAILKLLNDRVFAKKVKSILEQQEEEILDFAVQSCLKFPPNDTAEQAREKYQSMAKGKAVVMYLYVVDENDRLLGVIDIKELLQGDESVLLKDLMTSQTVSLKPTSTLREASEMFSRYGFRALPIADENDKILGVITYRDVMNLRHLFL